MPFFQKNGILRYYEIHVEDTIEREDDYMNWLTSLDLKAASLKTLNQRVTNSLRKSKQLYTLLNK